MVGLLYYNDCTIIDLLGPPIMVGCALSQLKAFFTAKNVEFFVFDMEQFELITEELGGTSLY